MWTGGFIHGVSQRHVKYGWVGPSGCNNEEVAHPEENDMTLGGLIIQRLHRRK